MADLTKHLMETDERFKISEERLLEELKQRPDIQKKNKTTKSRSNK